MHNIKKTSSLRRKYPQKKYNSSVVARIIWKMRYFLILSVIVSLGLAVLYNTFIPPVYESTVVLKKEKKPENYQPDDFKDLLLTQTSDEIETELELIKTTSVIDMVIKELSLALTVNSLEMEGKKLEINKWLMDYKNEFLAKDTSTNKFPDISYKHDYKQFYNHNYYIVSDKHNNLKLYNADNDRLLQESSKKDSAIFYIPNELIVRWEGAEAKSIVRFSIENDASLLNKLKDRISVNRKIKTDIFDIVVEAPTSFSAQQIGRVLTNKFIETRLEQQRQVLRYSFNFIDQQLNEFTDKLRNAQDELSSFKSSGKITTLNDNASAIVNFVSNLQAEKIKTELESAEYYSRAISLQNQLKSNKFIDQTYLTPGQTDQINSPFSALLRQLSDLEIQRIELMKHRKETHPDVINIDEQITSLKSQLQNYNKNTVTAYQIILDALDKKITDIDRLISSYENKIRLFPNQEMKLANLVRQNDAFEKIFTMLLNKREEMRIAELSTLQDIIIVDPPYKPSQPVSPNKPLNVAAGVLFGLLVGAFGIFGSEMWKNRYIQLHEIENNYNFPLLAIIPRYTREFIRKAKSAKTVEDKLIMLADDPDGFKESYRLITTKLLTKFNTNSKVLMVTSCEEGTGKTSVTANLAITLALYNKKVLIVDADLKRSRLSELFEVPKDSPGLLTLLTQHISTPVFQTLKFKDDTGMNRCINIIPSGGTSENSGNYFSSDKMQKLIKILFSSSYDVIIFDTPPITRVVDSLELCKYIKEVLIVVRSGHTMKESLMWGVTELDQAEVKILGTVMNACRIEETNYKYKYGYGYGYKIHKFNNGNNSGLKESDLIINQ